MEGEVSLHLLLLLLASPQEIHAVKEQESLIRVISAGRFETTFTKRKGFGSTWFDLRHDPERKRDLAPVLDENGLFWVKVGKPGDEGSWYATPSVEMNLLEDGPVRVRVRFRGPHMRYGYTEAKAAWKELRFEQVYTLYSDGSVFIAYSLEKDEPIPIHHFLVITKSNGSWGSQGRGEGKGEVKFAGETGAEKPTSESPTAFTLQWSNGPTYFTDILMVAHKGKFAASYWNEGYEDKDIRSSFDLGSLWPDRSLPTGKERLHFLMRFMEDINAAGVAARHAEDYRSPDRLTLTRGTLDTADEGDRDMDGYNEEEGCYVLKAAQGIAFTMHGATTPRVNPVFKIQGWPGASASVTMGGKALSTGEEAIVSVREGTLLLQIFATVTQDATIAIQPQNK